MPDRRGALTDYRFQCGEKLYLIKHIVINSDEVFHCSVRRTRCLVATSLPITLVGAGQADCAQNRAHPSLVTREMAKHVAEMLIRNEYGSLELALQSPFIVTETAPTWVIYGNPEFELFKWPIDRRAIAQKMEIVIAKSDGQILRFDVLGLSLPSDVPRLADTARPFDLSGPATPRQIKPEDQSRAPAPPDFFQWRLYDELRQAHCRRCHIPR